MRELLYVNQQIVQRTVTTDRSRAHRASRQAQQAELLAVRRQQQRRRITAARRRRQQRIFMRKAVFLLAAAAAVILLCTGFLSGTKEDAAPVYKYYKEVRVERNDSLWSIAQRYCTADTAELKSCIAEIRELNSLTGSKIYYGQYLTVPYYSDILQ